jgi:hypothetical protein
MLDQPKRSKAVVVGFFYGVLIGCFVGMPLYDPLKNSIAQFHGMITDWDPDNDPLSAYSIRHALISPGMVTTVWLLVWGLIGAGIGKIVKRKLS